MQSEALSANQIVVFDYDYGIVTISIAIAILASLISYDICLRARSASGSMRSVWLSAAAIAAGGGIWSMHFIGMLALRMPMRVTYDFWWTFASLVLPILLTWVGLRLAVVRQRSAPTLLLGGFIMGSGIIVMHFMGMAAMRMDAVMTHDPFLAALSVVLAMALSTAALFIAFKPSPSLRLAAVGAVVMGIAISSMHYTAIASCRMVMAPGQTFHDAAPIPVSLLAFAIFITLSTALLIVMLASRLDRRYTDEIEIRAVRATESIRRFRNLLRLSSDLISPLDAQGRLVGEVLSANRLLRYAPGDLSGRKFIHLVAQNDRPRVQGWLREAQGGEPVPRLQCALTASDGAEIPCECSAVRVEDPDSGWSIVISARDLTERQRMESRLYQSQRLEALGQMASGVAHDYSNLITAVSLNLESIERQMPSREILERLRLAQAALAHGNSLTRQLLAFARQQKVDPEPVDLNTVVTGIVSFLSLSLRGEVPISLDLEARLWPCMADRGMLEAALLNLAVNARDAMPNGGAITISTLNQTVAAGSVGTDEAPPGDYVALVIRDEGMGMTPDVVARAAEPFFTTKPGGRGTGLGLSMVFGFARQFGGDMHIDSAPGRGTTVRIRLPRTHAMPASFRTWDGAPVSPSGTILIIEDDLATRYASAILLREAGFTVFDVGSAEEARRLSDLDKVDILVTGTDDAGGTGLKLGETLAAHKPGLRVIATLGSSRANPAPPNRFRTLDRPYEPDDLVREVQRIIAEGVSAPGDTSPVAVVDPDPASRETLAALVGNAGFGNCKALSSYSDVAEFQAGHRPLIALVDAGSAEAFDGIDVGRRLYREFGIRIILVSSGVTRVPMDYPVEGVLVRSFSPDHLASILRKALNAA